jgi:hypothetical protein
MKLLKAHLVLCAKLEAMRQADANSADAAASKQAQQNWAAR